MDGADKVPSLLVLLLVLPTAVRVGAVVVMNEATGIRVEGIELEESPVVGDGMGSGGGGGVVVVLVCDGIEGGGELGLAGVGRGGASRVVKTGSGPRPLAEIKASGDKLIDKIPHDRH